MTYLTKPGHCERPEDRRYLRLLAGSQVELWDIVDINPGKGLIVQRAFTDKAPLLINESSGSQYLAPGQALLGRLLPMPKGRDSVGNIHGFHHAHQPISSCSKAGCTLFISAALAPRALA